MSAENLANVTVLDNPAAALAPFQSETSSECVASVKDGFLHLPRASNSVEATMASGLQGGTDSTCESSSIPPDVDPDKTLEFDEELITRGSKAPKEQDHDEAYQEVPNGEETSNSVEAMMASGLQGGTDSTCESSSIPPEVVPEKTLEFAEEWISRGYKAAKEQDHDEAYQEVPNGEETSNSVEATMVFGLQGGTDSICESSSIPPDVNPEKTLEFDEELITSGSKAAKEQDHDKAYQAAESKMEVPNVESSCILPDVDSEAIEQDHDKADVYANAWDQFVLETNELSSKLRKIAALQYDLRGARGVLLHFPESDFAANRIAEYEVKIPELIADLKPLHLAIAQSWYKLTA